MDGLPVGLLLSVNVAHVRTGSWTGSKGATGVDKRPVAVRTTVADDEVRGDSVLDRRHHGGPDQAVYAYSREDAQWWEAEVSKPLTPGMFGENLTTEGLDLTDAVIGEQWSVGSAMLEVSAPRIPCRVFARFWDEPQLIKRFTDRGHPGAYLRIVTPGELGAGDQIIVTDRPAHAVTIGETFRALTGDRSLAEHVLSAPQLPAKHRATLRKFAKST